MNKRLISVGVVTIGLLLLGSLSIPVSAPEPEGPNMGDFEGIIDLFSDLELTNNWIVGPNTEAASDLTNTNLLYSVTSAITPLDQFFNAGFFMGGDGSDGPQPEFAINGTFEGSELFVKIVNDQVSINDPTNRLLDWQAVLTLGEDIELSVNYPPELVDQGVPVDLLPTSVVMPAGSGTPPFPVVSSPTNFSAFEDLSEMVSDYGYDGLPFVLPSIFFVDDVNDAYSFWNNEVDTDKIFPFDDDGSENVTVTVTAALPSNFELTIEFDIHNDTADHGNITVMGVWNQASGLLEHFEIQALGDMDDNGMIEASELYFEFDLISTSQDLLPVSIGDKGEYVLNIDLGVVLDLVNETEEQFANEMLTEIIQAVEELNGEQLLNYTVDAMDGLYYHLDGYMLDFNRFLGDRLGTFFGGEPAGSGAQDPLPPIADYYHPFDNNMDSWGTFDFGINLFDAQMYQNTTSFLRRFDAWAQDNRTIEIHDWIQGIMNAQVYERNDWEMNYNYSISFTDNLATTSATEVYNGPVDYVEVDEMYFNGTDWVPSGHTYTSIQVNDSAESFTEYADYVMIFEIEAKPDSGFTSYLTKNNFMMMFGGNGGDEMNAGFGADELPPEEQGFRLPIDPQNTIPMPIRTPDWDQVGGAIILIEAYVDQLAAVITDPDFLAAAMNMEMADEGDSLEIHTFDFNLDWIQNASYVGADTYSELELTQVDNDTGDLVIVTTYGHVVTEEHYHWDNNGAFASMSSYTSYYLDIEIEDYPDDIDDTTTEPDDTTTDDTTDVEISPGFETVFALGSLMALPIFIRKRR